MDYLNAPRTARHFEIDARIFHKEEGFGTIKLDSRGVRYPLFDNGARGTPYTRLYPAAQVPLGWQKQQ